MRLPFVLSTIIALSLLAPIPSPVAAAPPSVTYSLEIVTGSGVLSDQSTYAVNVVSFVADAGNRHIVFQKGSLSINSDPTECTIQSVLPDCSAATLLCEDETHDVVAGVPGVSSGSIDGIDATSGLILLVCKASPPVAR